MLLACRAGLHPKESLNVQLVRCAASQTGISPVFLDSSSQLAQYMQLSQRRCVPLSQTANETPDESGNRVGSG